MSIPFNGRVSTELLQILKYRHDLSTLITQYSPLDDRRKWAWAYFEGDQYHTCFTPMDLFESLPILAAAIELSR